MVTETENEIVTCSCCGRGLRDNAEENVDYGKVPNPHDTGFGMCRECGGDPKAADVRKRMGWAACAFYDARIDVLKEQLNEDHKKRFDALPYEKKVVLIARLIEKGAMI